MQYIIAISFDSVYCVWLFTYASTHPGTVWRCHGCHHMAKAQESHRGLSGCRNTGAPELVQPWASRLRPEPASSPAGRYLQMARSTEKTTI